jgi:hypothetical protein
MAGARYHCGMHHHVHFGFAHLGLFHAGFFHFPLRLLFRLLPFAILAVALLGWFGVERWRERQERLRRRAAREALLGERGGAP